MTEYRNAIADKYGDKLEILATECSIFVGASEDGDATVNEWALTPSMARDLIESISRAVVAQEILSGLE